MSQDTNMNKSMITSIEELFSTISKTEKNDLKFENIDIYVKMLTAATYSLDECRGDDYSDKRGRDDDISNCQYGDEDYADDNDHNIDDYYGKNLRKKNKHNNYNDKIDTILNDENRKNYLNTDNQIASIENQDIRIPNNPDECGYPDMDIPGYLDESGNPDKGRYPDESGDPDKSGYPDELIFDELSLMIYPRVMHALNRYYTVSNSNDYDNKNEKNHGHDNNKYSDDESNNNGLIKVDNDNSIQCEKIKSNDRNLIFKTQLFVLCIYVNCSDILINVCHRGDKGHNDYTDDKGNDCNNNGVNNDHKYNNTSLCKKNNDCSTKIEKEKQLEIFCEIFKSELMRINRR
jgi:hypothetical protein